MAETAVPSHVAGFRIMGNKPLRFGVFGRDFLGHDSAEGLRVLKVLGEGEGVAVTEEDYAALAEDAAVFHFEAGQAVDQGRRVLTAHTAQVAAFGILVGGSPLQTQCVETTREFDEEQRCAGTLRNTTLVQRVQLLKALAEALARLHEAGRSFPYLTPWNVLLQGDAPRIAEVGLGFHPDAPGFDKAAIPEDVLVFLAPEVLRAIDEGSVVQVSTPADVYAFAATARAVLLNRVPDPHGLPGKDAPVEARRQLILSGTGLAAPAHQTYSRELEALLERALSVDPQRRPSAAELAQALGRLIEQDRVVWRAPAQWPRYAGVALGLIALLLALKFLVLDPLRGPPGLVKARQAYVAATRAGSLEERVELLRQAEVVEDGTPSLLPEARRLLALSEYHRWVAAQASGAEGPALEEVVARLESELAPAGVEEDELGRSARFVAAFLGRWELGGEAAEAGDAALAALAKEEGPRGVLAEAARRLTPAGVAPAPSPEELEAWAGASEKASREDGFLLGAYRPVAHYDDPAIKDPGGVSLGSGWIGYLILGRVQALRGHHEDARSKLEAAHSQAPTFATAAALGLELAAHASTQPDQARARELLEAALARRPFAEARLALARQVLRQAHAEASAARYREAAAAAQAATSTPPLTGDLDVAGVAGRLETEALFYEAVGLVGDPAAAEEAGRKLGALLQRLEEDPAAAERFGPDTRVARGLLRLEAGRAEEALEDLYQLFEGGEVTAGWAKLPDLPVLPKTREELTTVVETLYGTLLERIERRLGEAPSKDDLAQAEEDLARVQGLLGLPEAYGLDRVRMLLARARVALGRAQASGGAQAARALEEARASYAEALEKVDPTKPEHWFRALEGKLGTFFAEAKRTAAGEAIAEAVRPLRDALAELDAAAQKADRRVRREFDAFQAAQRDRLRTAFLERVGGFIEERREEWEAIDVARPGDPSQVAPEELAVLEQAGNLYPEGQVPEGERYRVAELLYRLAQLERVKRLNPQVLAHGERALELILDIDPLKEPRAEPLRQRVAYLLGWIALNEGESLKGVLDDPRHYGYDMLAAASGEAVRDFRDLKAKVKAGQLQPKLGPARAIATDIVRQYNDEALVPKEPEFGQPVRNANRIADDLRFATEIDRDNAQAHLVLGRVLFSMGEAEAAYRTARQAFDLAKAQGPDGLAPLVQAARLFGYARFKAASEGKTGLALATDDFKNVVEEGKRAAEELFRRDDAAALARYNYGPAYWAARAHYEEGRMHYRNGRRDAARTALEEARRAYEDFQRLIEGRDLPAEAASWRGEYNNLINTLRDLQRR